MRVPQAPTGACKGFEERKLGGRPPLCSLTGPVRSKSHTFGDRGDPGRTYPGKR
jgi:hypothetical protein